MGRLYTCIGRVIEVKGKVQIQSIKIQAAREEESCVPLKSYILSLQHNRVRDGSLRIDIFSTSKNWPNNSQY